MAKSRVTRWLIGAAAVATMLVAPATTQAYPYYRYDAGPSTLTLDRMDSSQRAGLQGGLDKWRHYYGDGDSALAMRVELYGQYVLPSRNFGLYGGLALAHLFADAPDPSGTGISNLDVGAFIMPDHTSDLIFRVGMILPTASDSASGYA